jgi:signal transduction histidine kinase
MKIMNKKQCLNFTNRYKCKDGSYKWIAWSASRYLEKGQSVAIGHDVTLSKENEMKIVENQKQLTQKNEILVTSQKELRKTLNALERAHRKFKKAQAQLVQSEKLALLGQLAAGIAHEINNPVAFISSNVEVLNGYVQSYVRLLAVVDKLKQCIKEKNLQQATVNCREIKGIEKEINLEFMKTDIHNLLSETTSGIDRIKNIVKDLSVFAREDKGVMVYNNITDIMESVVNIISNEFKYKGNLKKEYKKTPLLWSNAQKLGQVFLNILVNASQAIIGQGDILIKLYEKKKIIFVEISDTGEGIDQGHMGMIFDPFFTTKESGEGTGLGLSISYDIVKQHKGAMVIESEKGKGTKVILKFPHIK